MENITHVTNKETSEFCLSNTNKLLKRNHSFTVTLPEVIKAPVKKGDVVGSLTYLLDGKTLGTVEILADAAAEEASFSDYLGWMVKKFLI